mgnify:FL=1
MNQNGGGSRRVGIGPPAYRLPVATRVGAVRLQVVDLDRSIEYYTSVIGLNVLSSASATAVLGVAKAADPLVELQCPAGVRPTARRGRFGLYHFAILLPDRAALGRFTAHLAASQVRFGMADHLVSEALYLTDPDGLGIEVYADRSRALWRYHDGELMMATEPLDLNGLVTAAAGSGWTGVPAGTTIGHLHLHVGDLDLADAFYRMGLGFDKTVWSYPGALFFSAGGYHHHLGTNTWAPGPAARDDEARLLTWELVVPTAGDARAAAASLIGSGYDACRDEQGRWWADDPWGTRVLIRTDARVGP